MSIRYLRKKGLSTLSAVTLFFVGLCTMPCGVLKEAHAAEDHEHIAAAEMLVHEKAEKSCHGKNLTGSEEIGIKETASCPHCNSNTPVIMQEAKIKFLSSELPVKLTHRQFDAASETEKFEHSGNDPPPKNQKHPLHILYSVYII